MWVFTAGENSGSTFHMSSSAEKDDVKDAIEYYGVQVCKPKYFGLQSDSVSCIIH